MAGINLPSSVQVKVNWPDQKGHYQTGFIILFILYCTSIYQVVLNVVKLKEKVICLCLHCYY